VNTCPTTLNVTETLQINTTAKIVILNKIIELTPNAGVIELSGAKYNVGDTVAVEIVNDQAQSFPVVTFKVVDEAPLLRLGAPTSFASPVGMSLSLGFALMLAVVI
jgi:hypothetical protein